MGKIVYLEKPILEKPCLIIGFEGWPNAAEVSSAALQHLVENLKAKEFASVEGEDFYQVPLSRPIGVIKDGRVIEVKSPSNHFYYSKNPLSQDLILLRGVEPHLKWTAFVDLLLDLARSFSVSQIFAIGGTYDYIPHTYPTMVSAVFNREDMRKKVIRAGLGLTEYTGPISIHTFILEAAKKRGLKTTCLWGHAPQYLQTKNVRVVYSVLRTLADLIGIEIDLSELQRASDYFDEQVNHLVEQDPKLQEVIKKLEELYKQAGPSFDLSKEEGPKDEKVIYMHAFLKKQEDGDKKDG
ncbi:MAG: PAC2 family protein [Thermodesulfobacteriota bacterium]